MPLILWPAAQVTDGSRQLIHRGSAGGAVVGVLRAIEPRHPALLLALCVINLGLGRVNVTKPALDFTGRLVSRRMLQAKAAQDRQSGVG